MPELLIEGLRRTYPGRNPTRAVDDVRVTVGDGQILALLGPSGCGKTTTLRCVAGLEEPDEGLIRIGEHTVFDSRRGVRVPTHRRGIGLVFQSYALWPHMSAYKNIEFPLRAGRMPRGERAERVEEVAATVDLDPGLLAKRPGQLSGGQQQRVALARALVARPSLLLFDEPLSNLDAHLRGQLRAEIHSLHQRIGFTAVYVTHDLNEALALGDRVAVMSRGKVAQYGTPIDVFERPQDTNTARLLGFRRLCLVGGTADVSVPARESAGGVEMFARPEHVRVVRPGDPVSSGEITVGGFRVEDVSYLGEVTETTLRRGADAVQARSQRSAGASFWWQADEEVSLAVASADVLLFDEHGVVVRAEAEPRP